MKKTLNLLLLLWAVVLGACSSDEPKIVEPDPADDEWIDPVFAQGLQIRGYITDAKTVTPLDVADIEIVDVSFKGDWWPIKSVKGLSHFTSLKEFYCDENLITELDVANNTQLTKLGCSHNELTTLDLSNNTQLTKLNCRNNQLTVLDLSNNTKLTELLCVYNQLVQLDLANNPQLTKLWCFANELKRLDITNNTQLNELFCELNPGVYDGRHNKFVITAWFDSSAVPENFTQHNWGYDRLSVVVEYRKEK
ncbi:MAG: hypothetical protein K2M12_10190 [Muribaculaceae bacterium]|nr:hypothetical protein [Muribaculaceae bacterium]